MERQTGLAEALDIVTDKAKYDECAKKLLSFKAIDAWILKYCTEEFALYSIEYIMEHCLSGKVEISEHAVHQDQLDRGQKVSGDEQIAKLNSESSSIKEGTVYYDVRFNATIPEKEEPITLLINLEIQTKDKPGYELVTRGMYYCARMISEQYGTVFTNEHYEELQKVYSIWICPSTAKRRQNGMFRYHTIEELIFGNTYVKKKAYDLMEVVVVNLGEAEDEAEYEVMNLLNTLFSPTVSPDEKKKVLSEKYNIAMTVELESEVQRMCNLGTAIENKGIETGIEIGKREMILKMHSKGYTIAQIADVAGITEKQVEDIIKLELQLV